MSMRMMKSVINVLMMKYMTENYLPSLMALILALCAIIVMSPRKAAKGRVYLGRFLSIARIISMSSEEAHNKPQEEHPVQQQHDDECKNRKAELHDRELFTQPDETHLGECPLCFLPLPVDLEKSRSYSCCSQIICNGCIYANIKSNVHDQVKARSCAFCREMVSKKEEIRKSLMKRIKANDPAALRQMGLECYREGNCDGAIEYYTKAAELGNFHAHFK